MSKHWETTQDREYVRTVESPNGEWQATFRFDGCVDIHRAFNGLTVEEDDDPDSMHICDLDEFIEKLTELREIARAKFPEEY